MSVLQSQFTYNQSDSATDIFAGRAPISTTLASNIDDVTTDQIELDDTTGSLFRGVIAIDDELIFYGRSFGTTLKQELTRGYGGTAAASHTGGGAVDLHPNYYSPTALQSSVIAMQNKITDIHNGLE